MSEARQPPLERWTIGKRYRRRWKGRATYLGTVEQVPGVNVINSKEDFGCPVFYHLDLKNKYVHNKDGTMKTEHDWPSGTDKETCAPYDIVE